MKEVTPLDLKGYSHCALILECDTEGLPAFNARKFVRALKGEGAPRLEGLSFCVLALALSACGFSSASLGD
eukprot:CAMPEP_0206274104 /NCGR_PEP_ID=MMETSP0047_2-20121206/34968_1 /ASSEMBLY_ACC=CAM_ASM_000192 /TAXON_ID=195065 /ORGANISM="Chroomonas mesostigmatica_cf, Strain CCMP1168" /LENGTH=70 /DNA_ID=CAMNT_0053703279 /DNA_START=11 /DNA_END=220 /DNA_ORIENTATION=-